MDAVRRPGLRFDTQVFLWAVVDHEPGMGLMDLQTELTAPGDARSTSRHPEAVVEIAMH